MEVVKCALCLTESATKSNSHFLTYALIRKCIAQERETGREHRIFCLSCEKKFSEIEQDFMANIYPTIMQFHHNDDTEFILEEIDKCRLFFLLQVWRTAVCVSNFHVDDDAQEKLRATFNAYPDYDQMVLRSFPLAITLLRGHMRQYIPLFSVDPNPNIIWLCDIILQFYSSPDHIQFLDFYTLNEEETYRSFISMGNDPIKVAILSKKRSIKFLREMNIPDIIDSFFSGLIEVFNSEYSKFFGTTPTEKQMDSFLSYINANANDYAWINRNSEAKILELTRTYLNDEFGVN